MCGSRGVGSTAPVPGAITKVFYALKDTAAVSLAHGASRACGSWD